MAFYTDDELRRLGLAHVGRNVLIDRAALLMGSDKIWVGDNVRIDAFCILSASNGFRIVFAGHTHIAAGAYVYANGGDVQFELFASASPGSRIFTATDDFRIGYMHGPMVSDEFRKLRTGPVTLRENSCIAANVVVLPGCTIGVNATAGAAMVVTSNLPDHTLTYHRVSPEVHQKDPSLYQQMVARAKEDLKKQGYQLQ